MYQEEVKGAKFVVIGGGTGSFTLLTGLKRYVRDITAIVNMADDGGSTGQLRDELGVLPPGDVRQCLVALSESSKVRDLFNYRFEDGMLKGHSFGNLLLTALEKSTGNFAEAIYTASEILRVSGTVVPATLDDVRLTMEWPEKKLTLKGERVIDADYFKHDPRKAILGLNPEPIVNPAALGAIEEADVVVIAPGDLYTSLGPLLVIKGIGEALKQCKGQVVYVCNLVTKDGQTNGFTVSDHVAEIERFAGNSVIDKVLYNAELPPDDILERYHQEGAELVSYDSIMLAAAHYEAIGGDFVGDIANESAASRHLPVTRSLIRHDSDAVARQLMRIYFA